MLIPLATTGASRHRVLNSEVLVAVPCRGCAPHEAREQVLVLIELSFFRQSVFVFRVAVAAVEKLLCILLLFMLFVLLHGPGLALIVGVAFFAVV